MKRAIPPQTTTVDTEYLEFFSQPQYQQVTAYLVQGYEDAAGFHEVKREAVTIEGADYDALVASSAEGKEAGHFRNDDVLAAADKLRDGR